MKLILKQHLSGADGALDIGDPIEVTDEQAISYIEKGIAGFKTQKEHDAFMGKVKNIKAKVAANQAEAKAIIQKEHLENELNALYTDVVLKEAELNGVVLNDEQILEMVEELKRRILPGEGDTKSFWQKFTGK